VRIVGVVLVRFFRGKFIKIEQQMSGSCREVTVQGAESTEMVVEGERHSIGRIAPNSPTERQAQPDAVRALR